MTEVWRLVQNLFCWSIIQSLLSTRSGSVAGVAGFSVDLSRRAIVLTTTATSPWLGKNMASATSSANSSATFISSTGSTRVATAAPTSTDRMPRNIRWGIVGLGDVTEKKSGPPFYKAQGCELVAVMRRTPGKAAAWATRVPGGKCVGYDNLEDFLRHDGLDAVYVATRPGAHWEVGRQVAAAGKILYVEKPVGRCSAETQAMVDLTRISGQPVYTAYISRAYERTQAIRQLLREGVIGECVTAVEYDLVGTTSVRGMDSQDLPWRLVASEAGGGLIMDVGCHIIDRIDYFWGPIENVTGRAQNLNSPQQKVEDFVELEGTIGASDWSAIHSQGAKVYCRWDFSGRSGEEKDEMIIRGPKGSLRFVGMSASLPIYVQDENNNVLQEILFEMPEHTAQGLIQAITNELRGIESANFLSRTDNALRASKVLDTVLRNYYGNRDIGFWEQEEKWPGRSL